MAYQEGYLPTDAELQEAIRISLAAADGSLWANSARDEYGGLSQQTEFGQEINTAARIISAYAMNGGDVSKIPPSLQYLTSTDWANRIDAAGSGQWSDVLPALAVLGGGLAGVFGGAAAAGVGGPATAAPDAAWAVNPQTTGGLYGGSGLSSELAFGSPEASGMFGGTGAGEVTSASLAEQAASIGGGGSAAVPGTGTEAAGVYGSGGEFGGTPGTASYQFPTGDVVKGLLGTYFSGRQASDLRGAIGEAANRADPFAAQRPQYQEQFRGLTSSPSGFFQDPAIRDIIGSQQDATGRRLASQGYNMSGNFAAELCKVGQREAFGQYLPYSRMIGEAAGAFQGTQGAGQIAGQGALAGSTLQGQRDAGYGGILESIFRGQQPSGTQQAQGTQPNPNLMSLFLA